MDSAINNGVSAVKKTKERINKVKQYSNIAKDAGKTLRDFAGGENKGIQQDVGELKHKLGNTGVGNFIIDTFAPLTEFAGNISDALGLSDYENDAKYNAASDAYNKALDEWRLKMKKLKQADDNLLNIATNKGMSEQENRFRSIAKTEDGAETLRMAKKAMKKYPKIGKDGAGIAHLYRQGLFKKYLEENNVPPDKMNMMLRMYSRLWATGVPDNISMNDWKQVEKYMPRKRIDIMKEVGPLPVFKYVVYLVNI